MIIDVISGLGEMLLYLVVLFLSAGAAFIILAYQSIPLIASLGVLYQARQTDELDWVLVVMAVVFAVVGTVIFWYAFGHEMLILFDLARGIF